MNNSENFKNTYNRIKCNIRRWIHKRNRKYIDFPDRMKMLGKHFTFFFYKYRKTQITENLVSIEWAYLKSGFYNNAVKHYKLKFTESYIENNLSLK